MKPCLFVFILLVALCSGCAEQSPEMKFVDPVNPNNYLILCPSHNADDAGTFSINATDYLAGGTYTETSEAYSLKYSDAPFGITLKKVSNGIEIERGEVWIKE